MRAAYREIAARRRTLPPAVAVGMLDGGVEVLRVSTDAGEEFVTRDGLQAVRERAAVVNVEPLGPAPVALAGRRARELGFVARLAGSTAELARGLGVDLHDQTAPLDAQAGVLRDLPREDIADDVGVERPRPVVGAEGVSVAQHLREPLDVVGAHRAQGGHGESSGGGSASAALATA
jgi:hypothetical protein